MTIADDMLAGALSVLTDLGTTCTVVEVASVYLTDGTVTSTSTTHAAVKCSDLQDEAKRYESQGTAGRCAGTFYVPSSGLGFTPAVGNRVTYLERVFQAIRVDGFRVNGTAVAWRVDVAEVGS